MNDLIEIFNAMWTVEDHGYFLKGAPSPCHIWLEISGSYRHTQANRWIYSNTVRLLTPEETVNPRCLQKLCVNVKHMEVVLNRAYAAYYERRRKICTAQGKNEVTCAHGHLVKPEWTHRCLECSNASAKTNYHNSESYYDKRKRIGKGIEPVKCVNGHVVLDDGAKSCRACGRIKQNKHRSKS